MDPCLANPYLSTVQILNHEVPLQERQHSIKPLKLPIKESHKLLEEPSQFQDCWNVLVFHVNLMNFFSECTEMHIHQTNKHKEIAYI